MIGVRQCGDLDVRVVHGAWHAAEGSPQRPARRRRGIARRSLAFGLAKARPRLALWPASPSSDCRAGPFLDAGLCNRLQGLEIQDLNLTVINSQNTLSR